MPNLFLEVTSKSLARYLQKREYDKKYFQTFFPLRYTPFLDYETLIGEKNNAAASVVSYNSSAPEATRRTIKRLTGSIPPIRIKRILDEKKINEYNVIKAQLKATQDMTALLDIVYNDTDFVINSILERMEWLALKALTQFEISLTVDNNARGVVTEENVNFGLESTHKEVCTAADQYWDNANILTNDPIADIVRICSEARQAGVKIRYIVMNASKFADFKNSTAVKNYIYGVMITSAGLTPSTPPTLELVNKMLTDSGHPKIIVIDEYIQLEDINHDFSGVDPLENDAGEDKLVTFLPDLKMGDFLFGPIAAETNPLKDVDQHKVGNILVQVFGESDPVRQFTVGLTNCFPSYNRIDEVWSLNSESHTSW